MRYKNHVLSSVLFIAIGLAAWFTLSYRGHTNDTAEPSASPDAYMEGVTAIIMDPQGKMTMKIVTPKVTHYNSLDRAEFTDPQLTIYRKSSQPWYVTSIHAKTTNGLDNIDFWDDVVIHHSADRNNPATLIKTTHLTVHPNEQTANTDDPITMIQPNIVVKGVGMLANMNSGDVKLLKESRAEYVPS